LIEVAELKESDMPLV